MDSAPYKDILTGLWQAGVDAANGEYAVMRALQQDASFSPDLIVAVGKAAGAMCRGALQTLRNPCAAIVVTKYGHIGDTLAQFPHVRAIEAAHPVPDRQSLVAGAAVMEAVAKLPANASLLLLVSGGASALAECLPQGMNLVRWQQLTSELVSSGKTIAEINTERKGVSLIKDGKLLQAFKGGYARVYAISDVQGDDIAVIGSGIGDSKKTKARVDVRIIASNRQAREAVAHGAKQQEHVVRKNEETLYGDVDTVAERVAMTLIGGLPGVYIWGGEPTIELPSQPGNGGRNQSLAMNLARSICGRENLFILAAGTDGTDGPTDAAGAIVDGNTWLADAKHAEQALSNADAGTYLRASGDIFITGPTNTNVMDLVIALVR